MLVERGVGAANGDVAADAYAIATNHLRRSGAIADNLVTSARLLGIVVHLLHRGEDNTLKLANRAIARLQSELA
jgi:hypothetical protein